MFLALRQLVLGVCLVATLASPAGMVSTDGGSRIYSDVAAGSMCSEAIASVTDEGLMSGVGDGRFQPERDVTAHELAFVLCKMSGVDATWMNCVGVALAEGYYDEAAASYGSSAIPAETAMVAIRRASGIPAEFGALSRPDLGMSRGEVAHSIVRARLWREVSDRISITAEPGYESVMLEVRAKMMTVLPEEVVRALADNGWSVDVGGTYIKDYMARNADKGYSSIIGLCSFGPKTIHVTTQRAIVHESGHFWSRVMCQSRSSEALFKAEGQAGKKLLGSYSTTNHLEFMAEAFRYYVENRYDEEAMAAMRDAIPLTYAEFVAREANGWVPAV